MLVGCEEILEKSLLRSRLIEEQLVQLTTRSTDSKIDPECGANLLHGSFDKPIPFRVLECDLHIIN